MGAMNAPPRVEIPLRPSPEAIAESAVSSVVRAVIASAHRSLHANADAEFADDRGANLILKSPVSPTSRADATVLATIAVSFISSLTGVSAEPAALIARSLKLTFDHAASVSSRT